MHLTREQLDSEHAWEKLADCPLNAELPEGKRTTASHNGEVWQYMGTDERGHCFRHRCHPTTNKREYVFVVWPGVGSGKSAMAKINRDRPDDATNGTTKENQQ